MPRSSRTGTPLELDLEIEKTAKRLRKQAKLRKKQQASQTASSSNPPIIDIWQDLSSSETETESESDNNIPHTPPSQINHTPMAENPPLERTLRQWATQDVTQQPLCITYPHMTNFELKSGLIHLLPQFRGVEN
ncbi:hypothetical protein L2E82_15562 [Cichorium intybus]|uniref:Uncharacterized protein n=1 Tax=Cichorium intybus TaxID=13427 RepID=A0ACB9F3L6_CICIN|nr:hypothetical protein L2E82_15562 [Cichorium intybus]